MAIGGALAATTRISTSSVVTFARNYATTYLAPKLFECLGANRSLSNITGAFLAGGIISGFDYKWNKSAMLNQGLT